MTDTTIPLKYQTRDAIFRLKRSPKETYDDVLRRELKIGGSGSDS